MHLQQKRMIGHGAVIMILGLLSGFGLVMSLIGGFEVWPGNIVEFTIPGDSGAWARAHSGGLMNGLMIILGAFVIQGLALPEKAAGQVTWMLIGAGYANTMFYYGAILSQTRALTFGDNRFGETSVAGVLGFAPALVFVVITIIAFAIIAKHAFASSEH